MDIPSYIATYFFTLSRKSHPMQTTILRKLTLFQHTATFHISSCECIPAEQLLNSTVMEMICFIDPACFFGDECQFYTKDLGSTLDEILGYELKRNTILPKQFITVIMRITITMIIFVIGIVNCILSIMVYGNQTS
ncbi:unnamed protein product [Adineta steineri]|uniref:Uncharacterized protein n=1 Tax=Adineta steineri TaxID=433720 RepID=A0A814G888_9BILA|nr:unnamed protein product [Adineta steineri]